MLSRNETEPHSSPLAKAIRDYLLWMIDQGYADSTWRQHEELLRHFSSFIEQRAIGWDQTFTLETLETFQKECKLVMAALVVRGLARYLHKAGTIPGPLKKPPCELPAIYEEYLRYYAMIRQQDKTPHLLGVRRLLAALHQKLESSKTELAAVKVEQLDAVLAEQGAGLTKETLQKRRSWLRGFLRYLHLERGVLPRDLAPFIVGAPQYTQAKPPKFLRPREVETLFAAVCPQTAKELRTHAMLHLAYALGLRPKEISLIRLDDISFSAGEINLPDRKGDNPMRLPLPEAAIKAIAAYLIGGRPKTTERALFQGLTAPYRPVSPVTVSKDIRCHMHKAGLPASAYWLRHTYAQNLLETNASIFEIKEMMGHDLIQTTKTYLHIHTRLMREVLFDETL